MILYKPIYTLQQLQTYLSDAPVVAFDFETASDEKYRNEDKAALDAHKSHIAGQGSLSNINEGIDLVNEKHIVYHPAVKAQERKELLGSAKAVLMPTYYLEPFGGVNVEAQLCGTPVITSDWGAFPETVLHGLTGYRCRVFEEFCWAVNNIENIKPALCRQWAVNNYSMERIGKMYEEYFQRISRLFDKGWYEPNSERQQLSWLERYYPAVQESSFSENSSNHRFRLPGFGSKKAYGKSL